MARKVIDIIYNLVRKRLTLKGDGTGITSLPRSDQVERGMQNVFKRLREGGYNPVSAEKVIKNEDDLARVLQEINQKQRAEATARQKAAERLERVMDKMNRGIPLNPSDQASLEGSGFKTTLDAFKGFEPKVIPGGKKPRDKKSKGGLMNAVKKLQKKFGKNIIQKGKASKKSEKKKLQDLFREFNRKNKAGGGLAYMLGEPREEMAAGGTALRRLLQFLNKQSGKTGSQALKEMKLSDQVKFFAEKQGFNPDQARIEYLEQVLDALKADRKMIRGLEPGAPSTVTGKAKDEMELIADKMFKESFLKTTQGGRFRGLSSEAIDSSIMELEGILKNLKTKGRKLNANGGRIGLASGGTYTQSLPSVADLQRQFGQASMPNYEGGKIVYDTGSGFIYERPGQRGFEYVNPKTGVYTSLGSMFTDLPELLDSGVAMRNPNDPVRLAQEAAAATRAKVNIPTPTPTPTPTPSQRPIVTEGDTMFAVNPNQTREVIGTVPEQTPMTFSSDFQKFLSDPREVRDRSMQTPTPGTLRLEDIDQTGMPRPITQEDVDTFNFRPTGSDPLSQNIFSGVFNALVGARPQGVESLSLANTFEENLALNEKRRLANQAFRQGAMDLLSRRDSLTNEDIIDFGKNLGIPENVSSDVLNRLPNIMEGLRSEGGLSGIIPPEFRLGKIIGSPDALYGADPRLADDPLAGSFSGGITLDGRTFRTEQDAIAGLGLERYNQLMATGGRVGFADGGMSRRTFLKIMAALAAFPLVGKLTKTAKVAKGTAPLVTKTSEMPEHFPKLVEKILREGQVVKKDFVKKTGDVTTYRHPDRPDIELTIEGEGNRIQLDFDTDQGMRGGYEFKKGDIIDEPTSRMRGKRGPDEFIEGEVKYKGDTEGNYYKDFEEGIDTGTENLDEFAGVRKQKTSKSKINLDQDFAAGGLAGLLGE